MKWSPDNVSSIPAPSPMHTLWPSTRQAYKVAGEPIRLISWGSAGIGMLVHKHVYIPSVAGIIPFIWASQVQRASRPDKARLFYTKEFKGMV